LGHSRSRDRLGHDSIAGSPPVRGRSDGERSRPQPARPSPRAVAGDGRDARSLLVSDAAHQRLERGEQLIMRDDLVGIVERQLHRKVIAFMSQNHIDPDLAVEVFVLEPADAF
jgi:hypothetical protein